MQPIVPAITLGAGKRRTKGRRCVLPAATPQALADALATIPANSRGAWWNTHTWRNDDRGTPKNGPKDAAARWLSSIGPMVDIDYHDASGQHAAPPPALAARLAEAVRAGKMGGNVFHATPRGARLVFVLAEPVDDPARFQRIASGAVDRVAQGLASIGAFAEIRLVPDEKGRERKRPCDGFHVDHAISSDLMRFVWAPSTIIPIEERRGDEWIEVGEEPRTAEVVVIQERPSLAMALEAMAPTTSGPQAAPVPAATPRTAEASADVHEAVRRYNADHAREYPKSDGHCPACGHKDCFGQLAGDPAKWSCFSSNHGGDSNDCGTRGEGIWFGDALDLDAHAAGVDRHAHLRAKGYLARGKGKRSSARPAAEKPAGEAKPQPAVPAPEAPVDPLAFAGELAKQLQQDPGAAFEPANLARLAEIRKDPAAWARIKPSLKAAGGLRDLDTAIRAYLRTEAKKLQASAEPTTTETVANSIPDAPPAARDLEIPFGYYLAADATGRLVRTTDPATGAPSAPTPTPFARAPILISMAHRDAESGAELLRVAWRRTNRWHERVVGREVVMNANKLLELASHGLSVGTHNAKDLSRYLAAFEAANDDALTGPRISSRLGWQGPKAGAAGFLAGRTYYPLDGSDPIRLDLEHLPDDWHDDWIVFRGSDAGDEQIADGFTSAGSLAGWLELATEAAAYPRALLAFYASLVPPMLEILGAPNFIVDWSGQTSLGKTTCLRLAASVWGNPDERSPTATISSWDATRVATERRGALLSSLPLIIDDTKRAKDKRAIAEMLYQAANGRGRDRGSLKGTARTLAWRTVLLSSGEAAATSYTEDGGTRARTLCIVGAPFGGQGDGERQVVDRLNLGLQMHHGHVGPAFIRALLAARADWPKLAELYRDKAAQLAAENPSGVAARMARYVAAIEIAASFAHVHLSLPWAYRSPFAGAGGLWEEIAAAAEEAPPEVRAMQGLASWCQANENDFLERVPTSNRIPPQGWAGMWDAGSGWRRVAIYPTKLERVLADLGFEPAAVLEAARARGWLETDGDRKRNTKRMRVGRHLDSDRQRFYVFTRQAFEDVGAVERTSAGATETPEPF